MIKTYFFSDLRRLFKHYELYASVFAIALVLFFSLEDMGFVNNSVMMTYFASTHLSGCLLTYIFCAFPFAAVFCEDLENQYIRYAVIRKGERSYVISKVVLIYLSSVMVMALGTFLFLLLCRTQVPWADLTVDGYEIQITGRLGFLAEEGHYVLYCLAQAVHFGMLAGMLSVVSAFVSLYVTNKMMVWLFPMLLQHVLSVLSGNTNWSLEGIFYLEHRMLPYDWQNHLQVLCISILPVILCTIGICRKVRKRW